MRHHPLTRTFLVGAILAASAAGSCAYAQTAPTFARIFGDHAVLQRSEPITVWGAAASGQRVAVRLGNQSTEVTAGANGSWRATLPAMPAGGPYTLSATSGAAATTLKDIMVGDVYLCGGQSNMAFPARLSTNAWNGFPANDAIRFVNIQNDSEALPQNELKRPVQWKVATSEASGEASAVCYYMARNLQKELKIPLGFIGSNWGGTTIQGWISPASLRTVTAYDKGVASVMDLGVNPARARADDARLVEQWWDKNIQNASAERAWIAPDFDDAKWPSLTGPGSWKDSGISEFKTFDGVAWFRNTVDLTPAQAQAANQLQLGPLDQFDTTWVNGVRVGGGGTHWVWRDYHVPAGVFKPGRNVIVVRVLGGENGGGLTSFAQKRGIKTTDNQFIALSAPWKYQLGMRAKGLSVPASPWDVPTSLTTLHNAMIAPLAGYKFKLAAWYQGESNAGAAKEYETLLPLMMADWRKTFGQPDLPFLIVQLTAYGSVATKPGQSNWAQLREAQAKSVRNDRHAALIVTTDIGDRFDIHPTQKTVIGERMARAARVVAYGATTTVGGPEASSAVRSGADVVVAFKNTNGGLRTYSSNHAIGFEVCAKDACQFALAMPQGASIILKGANRPDVTHVRYAWADAPYVNLYSADDQPAAPFEIRVN